MCIWTQEISYVLLIFYVTLNTFTFNIEWELRLDTTSHEMDHSCHRSSLHCWGYHGCPDWDGFCWQDPQLKSNQEIWMQFQPDHRSHCGWRILLGDALKKRNSLKCLQILLVWQDLHFVDYNEIRILINWC